MAETTDIFEVMGTMRAMRRLKPDPVPDELINKILQAAQWAPSGGNTQRWRFLVVKDPEIKKKVQVYYKRLYDEIVGPRYASSAPPPGSDPARYERQHAAVKYLTEHYHEAPVWIVACLDDGQNPDRTTGSIVSPRRAKMIKAMKPGAIFSIQRAYSKMTSVVAIGGRTTAPTRDDPTSCSQSSRLVRRPLMPLTL